MREKKKDTRVFSYRVIFAKRGEEKPRLSRCITRGGVYADRRNPHWSRKCEKKVKQINNEGGDLQTARTFERKKVGSGSLSRPPPSVKEKKQKGDKLGRKKDFEKR